MQINCWTQADTEADTHLCKKGEGSEVERKNTASFLPTPPPRPRPPAPGWARGGAQVERPGSLGPQLRRKFAKAPEVRPTSALPSVHRVSRILCCSRYSRQGPVSPAAACCFSSYTRISSICFSRQGISVFLAGVFSSNRDPGNKVNGVKSRDTVA